MVSREFPTEDNEAEGGATEVWYMAAGGRIYGPLEGRNSAPSNLY